jgi:hypothetical protein
LANLVDSPTISSRAAPVTGLKTASATLACSHFTKPRRW